MGLAKYESLAELTLKFLSVELSILYNNCDESLPLFLRSHGLSLSF
jgi:hypothetical protein